MIFSKLYAWLAGAAALVLGVAGVYFKGRSSAKAEVRTEAVEEALENVVEAKTIEDEVETLTDEQVNDELEEFYRD